MKDAVIPRHRRGFLITLMNPGTKTEAVLSNRLVGVWNKIEVIDIAEPLITRQDSGYVLAALAYWHHTQRIKPEWDTLISELQHFGVFKTQGDDQVFFISEDVHGLNDYVGRSPSGPYVIFGDEECRTVSALVTIVLPENE